MATKERLVRRKNSDIIVVPNPCSRRIQSNPVRNLGEDEEGLSLLDLQQDDLMHGKSCTTDGTHWTCRDCGLHCDNNKTYTDCPVIPEKRKCDKEQFIRPWDDPIMLSSTLDMQASIHPARELVRMYPFYEKRLRATRKEEKRLGMKRLACRDGVRDRTCFDLSKCESAVDGGPIKVYVYNNEDKGPSTSYSYLKKVVDDHSGVIAQVTDESEACLKVLSCQHDKLGVEPFQSFDELLKHPGWNQGENHFIWLAGRCFQQHFDFPFTGAINFQKAALSNPNYYDLTFRYGFDMMHPYYPEKHEAMPHLKSIDELETKPRKYLLTFKGSGVPVMTSPWYQHRNIAFKYWEEEEDVILDYRCMVNAADTYAYRYPDYVGIMTDSKFVFCPGGASPSTYRFYEALMMGAIPVVTSDLVEPFSPDIDWSTCIVRISHARIVDLPRLLRQAYNEGAIQERRSECLKLFRATIGYSKHEDKAHSTNGTVKWSVDVGQQLFTMSMLIWAKRIRSALGDASEGQSMVEMESATT